MQNPRSVLVVGAGPTGLTAAIELSRMGVPLRLIDKKAQFSDTSRALAVQARTLELFAQRGLADEMVRLGNKGTATAMYADGKQLGRLDLSRIPSRFHYLLLLPQSETERLLREQVERQGVTVELSTELVAFAQNESESDLGTGSVRAILRRPDGSLEEVEAAYLIAAEGAHSSLRKTLALDFRGKSLPHSYALADLHLEGDLAEGELSIFLAQRGLMAVFPMGGHRFRVIATGAEQPRNAPDPDLARMQALYDSSSHIPARLYGMVWSSWFRINSRMIDRLRDGLVFFGGDAAHIHSPAGGQGMNTGIQDMVNLCWKLALVLHGQAGERLLDTYEAERIPVIRSIVNTTEGATEAANAGSPLMHAAVTHLASAALSFGRVQQAGAGMVSELGAQYRKSALSAESHGGGSLRSGDRVPDLPITLAAEGTEKAANLQDCLDPSRFTLLELGSPVALTPTLSTIVATGLLEVRRIAERTCDSSRFASFHTVFGSAKFVLVRPDGYVALVGGSHGAQHLDQWIETWLAGRGASPQGPE